MYRNIAQHKFVLTTSGSSYLSPTYVTDVVRGIIKAIGNEKAYNEIFNLSADTDLTVQEYLDTIAEYFHTGIIKINIGYRLSVFLAGIIEGFCNHVLKRDGFVSKSKIDFLAVDHSTSSKKAQELMGFHADHDFAAGFEKTMKWCREKGFI